MADTVMEQICTCLDEKKNFLLSAGAGSGKTYTLVHILHYIFDRNPKVRVACKRNSRASIVHRFLWR